MTFIPSPFLGVLSIETLLDHSGRTGSDPPDLVLAADPGALSSPDRCCGSEDIWAVFMEAEARGSLWLASEHSGRGPLETPQHRDIIEEQGPCSRE